MNLERLEDKANTTVCSISRGQDGFDLWPRTTTNRSWSRKKCSAIALWSSIPHLRYRVVEALGHTFHQSPLQTLRSIYRNHILLCVSIRINIYYFILSAGDRRRLYGLILKTMLPSTQEFITYQGSLSFPACHETVTWILLNAPVTVTEELVSPNIFVLIIRTSPFNLNIVQSSCFAVFKILALCRKTCNISLKKNMHTWEFILS